MEKVFVKGTHDLEKDIIVKANDYIITNDEFRDVVTQIKNSDISYMCSSIATSANKALDLCNSIGLLCDDAYEALRKRHGKLWNYTGD